MKPKVYVTRPIPQSALDHLSQETDLRGWTGEVPVPPDILRAEVRDVEGLVIYGKGFPLHELCDRVDAALLERAPRLRTVAIYGDGVDNVDLPACTARGISVTYTPSDLTDAVADHTLGLLLSAARRIPEGIAYIRQGRWQAWCLGLTGRDVHGATLGLVGLGRIAAAVARRALGFAMRLIYFDVERRHELEAALPLEYLPLDAVLAQADFVSLHVPLTPETKHMIGRAALAKMKRSAILINTARGNIVDGAALAEALAVGQIAGAALDVTDPEPLPADHPLANLPNVIVTPHIAAETGRKLTAQSGMVVDNLLAALRGQRPPHLLNPEVLNPAQPGP
jgi:glyoxylate reductase